MAANVNHTIRMRMQGSSDYNYIREFSRSTNLSYRYLQFLDPVHNIRTAHHKAMTRG